MIISGHAGNEKWRKKHSTEIFLEPGAHKNKFWHRHHLNPKSISDTTDYVWIIDGDIRLRNIAWNIVSRFKPAIFAPTIMASTDLEREQHKILRWKHSSMALLYGTQLASSKQYGTAASNGCTTIGNVATCLQKKRVANHIQRVFEPSQRLGRFQDCMGS